MKKNLLDNLDNIKIDDIVINCTICNNRVVLFQNACGACLSTEFWKGSPFKFGIAYNREIASAKAQTCVVDDYGYPDSYFPWIRKGRPEIKSKTNYYLCNDIRRSFFNLPKSQRSKIYKSLLNKFKNEIHLKN